MGEGTLEFDFPLLGESVVELAELGQETVIGANLPVLSDDAQGGLDIHLLAHHEVRDDQSRGAAIPFAAVNKHSAVLLSQGLVDEVCGLFEEGAEVELLRVVGLDAQVGDA